MRRAASSDPRSAEEGQSRLTPCKLSLGLCAGPAFAARRSAYFVMNSACGCVSGMRLLFPGSTTSSPTRQHGAHKGAYVSSSVGPWHVP